MIRLSDIAAIQNLEPTAVWRFFVGMAAIPRPSKKEDRIRAHMTALAKENGFGVREDKTGNILIEVPAKPGCEHAPITVIQGHLDMVCEKNSDNPHDFDNDPIQLVLDEWEGRQIVRANGTTLGSDNGVGIALGLAAACDPEVKHGPLEILLTIDEEAGMTGAKALEPEFFKGRRMVNLDAEEDNSIYIGCAGGCDANLNWSFETAPIPDGLETCKVQVSGFRGGHSGCDIHENRGNAIKALVQVLEAASEGALHIVDFRGGSVRNAIPREAWAVVAGAERTIATLEAAAEEVQAQMVRTNGEEGCSITVDAHSPEAGAGAGGTVISKEDSQTLLRTLAGIPSGVLAVVPEIPGLIQTSNNLATIAFEREASGKNKSKQVHVTSTCLARSSSHDQIMSVIGQIEAIGRLGGAVVESGNEYPGWQPNVDSPLLAICTRLYEEVFGVQAEVTAIHAGLECGIINERVGGTMDMISFGPTIECAHSPDERIYVDSVQKIWKYLTVVLEELTR